MVVVAVADNQWRRVARRFGSVVVVAVTHAAATACHTALKGNHHSSVADIVAGPEVAGLVAGVVEFAAAVVEFVAAVVEFVAAVLGCVAGVVQHAAVAVVLVAVVVGPAAEEELAVVAVASGIQQVPGCSQAVLLVW